MAYLVPVSLGSRIGWHLRANPTISRTSTRKAPDQRLKDNPGQVDNFVAHSKAGSVVEKWMANHPERQGHARLHGTPHIDPIGSERFKDFLNQSRKDRDDLYKDSNFLVRGANWVLDKEQDYLEKYTGFDKVKGMKESRIERISGTMDPFTILDGSATRVTDPTWIYHLKDGAGHYFGNIADLYAGFDGPDGDGAINKDPNPKSIPILQPKLNATVGTSKRPRGIDPNYRVAPDTQRAMTQPWNYTTPVNTDSLGLES